MSKQIITYKEYGNILNELVRSIQDKRLNISAVHGLPRGGLPIAVHISHYLEIPIIINLTQFQREFPNGTLLVVDDIVDTGKTFDRFIEFTQINNIKFISAVLFYKEISEYVPDFYVKETNSWIIFPWERVDEKPSTYHQTIYTEEFCQDPLSGGKI